MRRLCGAYAKALALLSNSYAAAVRLAARIKRPARPTNDFPIGRSSAPLQETVMGQLEPPSGRAAPLSRMFHIGRNSRGNWVVKDQKGLCGGLFVDRAEALKFAMFENGNRPQAVIMVPGILELDMSRKPRAAGTSTSATQIPVARAA